MSKARPSGEVKAVDAETLSRFVWESPETTHLTVVDKERNVVSLTFTVNGGFGAGVVAAGTGILLNNEMDDFAAALGVPNLFGLVGGEGKIDRPGEDSFIEHDAGYRDRKWQICLQGAPEAARLLPRCCKLCLMCWFTT